MTPNRTAKSHTPVVLRRATPDDVPSLVRLNHAAYPDLVEENVVWNAPQLYAHLSKFPRGQVVAERQGVIVGALSTFIVPKAKNALAPHTWTEITDDGRFTGHDELGDSLYLADVYVDPKSWGTGVGVTLYQGLRDLCKKLRLRRIVAGGRLWGYFEVDAQMTAEEYVAQVIAGVISDRVLTSQLRAGFVVRGILPGYLKDARSRNYATLLEWVNPELTAVQPASALPRHPPLL